MVVPESPETTLGATWYKNKPLGNTGSRHHHAIQISHLLTGLDVSQEGHSLLSSSVQMASAWPSGSNRVAAERSACGAVLFPC